MRSRPTRRPLALAVASSLCPSSAALRSLSSALLLATAAQLAQAGEKPAAGTPTAATPAAETSAAETSAADPAPQDQAKTLDAVSVISTGTRKANMAVSDSPAPI